MVTITVLCAPIHLAMFRILIEVEFCSVSSSITGLLKLVYPQVSSMLLQMAEFPFKGCMYNISLYVKIYVLCIMP